MAEGVKIQNGSARLTDSRSIAFYAVAAAAVIAVSGHLLSLVYSAPEQKVALITSAVIAFVVQLITFAVLRRMRETKVMFGWGIGMVTRVVVLVVYALVVVRVAGLAMEPALIGLALFFVLCTVLEPLLLER